VTVAVGSPEEVDKRPSAATSHKCEAGGALGTIVTVPSGEKNDRMSIRITAGVDRDPADCEGAGFGTGCIVARRALRFVPHTPLTLDVSLRSACNGVTCGPAETCVVGVCTSADVVNAGTCTGQCDERALTPTKGWPGVPSPLVCGDMQGLQPGALWPMMGYCPTRIGRSPRAGAQTNNVRWTANVGAPIASGISIAANGTIYFGASDNRLYAAGPDGRVKWSSRTGAGFSVSTASIARDGSLYMGNSDTNLYAFEPGGGVKWTFGVGGLQTLAPNVGRDGSVYVGGGSGGKSVFALDSNGTKRWEFPTGADIWSSPTIGLDGTIYFGSEDSNLYAVRPDGTKKWAYFANEGLQTTIVSPSGWLYFNGKPSICALDGDGNLKWITKTDGDCTVPALAADGTVYAGTASGIVYAFDGFLGIIKWQIALTPFDTWTQPVVGADGLIYLGATDGTFYALTPEGSLKWQLKAGGAIHGAPAIGKDGTVYFGSDDGLLYAVGP
jgi:outer membrane protein assembly factor BamB